MATQHSTFARHHQSETIMKKEFWRKAPQCAKCQFHCPEGTRPDSIDPTTVWKEACRCSGYSFWPELEESEICFDFKTEGQNSSSKDKAEKEQWAMQHRCHGYTHDPAHDKGGFCSSFLTIAQWAEVESLPIYNGERKRKWAEFKEMNLNSHDETSLL